MYRKFDVTENLLFAHYFFLEVNTAVVAQHNQTGEGRTDRQCTRRTTCSCHSRVEEAAEAGACLVPKFIPKFYYAKRKFPITSKRQHIYGVLNVDEIKN
jgi:hypothetical protein